MPIRERTQSRVERPLWFTIPPCLQLICNVKKRRLGVNLVHAIQFEYFRERITKVSGFQFHTHPGICAADGVKPQPCPDAHTASPITPLITSAQRKAVDWLGHQARCNLPVSYYYYCYYYYYYYYSWGHIIYSHYGLNVENKGKQQSKYHVPWSYACPPV